MLVERVLGVGVDVDRTDELARQQQRQRQRTVHTALDDALAKARPHLFPTQRPRADRPPLQRRGDARPLVDGDVLDLINLGHERVTGGYASTCRSGRSNRSNVTPAPSAPGMACAAKVATCPSRPPSPVPAHQSGEIGETGLQVSRVRGSLLRGQTPTGIGVGGELARWRSRIVKAGSRFHTRLSDGQSQSA